MHLALLTVDDREFGRHSKSPIFGSAISSLLEGFSECPTVTVSVLSCVRDRSYKVARLGPNATFYPVFVSPAGWLRSGYLGCAHAIRKAIRKLSPDIIHAQGSERWCATAGIFQPIHPRILTLHGNIRLIDKITPLKPRSYWLAQKFLEYICLPRYDGIISLSKYASDHLSPSLRALPVIPNGIESSFFSIRRVPTHPPKILFIANIQERKNQINWIDAIIPLMERIDFEVHFFGDAPPDVSYTKEFLLRVNRFPKLHFRGRCDRDTLKTELSQATLLVLPSLEENCPMSVLEAIAANVPVIISHRAGMIEMIQDGVTGLFCDPDSASSMKETLSKLLFDSELRTRISARAQSHALRLNSPRSIAEKHRELYTKLMEGWNDKQLRSSARFQSMT